MNFAGLQKTSLLDFPDKLATVVFVSGCNLRCPFCHNWRLVLEPRNSFLSEETVLQVLDSRRKYINAVVVTGGEPTLHVQVPQFLKTLKERGFATKIDTNGFFPDVLKKCLPYLDYVALDVKTSLEQYQLLGAENLDNYLRTIEMLKEGSTDYEFRNTVVPGFVDSSIITKMGEVVEGAKRFVFQQFVPGDTLDNAFNAVKPYSRDIIAHFADLINDYVDEVLLRI
jgi:pyruvate formate lyase activating enzyme